MSEADENKPSSSPAKAIAIGVVVQVAPRVSGDITEVMVQDNAVVQAEANLASTVQGIDASAVFGWVT